jgi:acetyl/propionyl-CoA carboxylase alpha subunit
MFGVDPLSIGVGLLVWLAFRKQTGTQFGAMTPEREELFRNAMAHCADPAKLVALADIFKQEGLKAEAFVLRKRAEWRARSQAKREEHAAIFEKAMKSENVAAILTIAQAFEDMTASFKAQQLRTYVQSLNEKALKAQAEKDEKEQAEAAAKLEAPKPATVSEVKAKNGAGTAVIPGNTEPLPKDQAVQ